MASFILDIGSRATTKVKRRRWLGISLGVEKIKVSECKVNDEGNLVNNECTEGCWDHTKTWGQPNFNERRKGAPA